MLRLVKRAVPNRGNHINQNTKLVKYEGVHLEQTVQEIEKENADWGSPYLQGS